MNKLRVNPMLAVLLAATLAATPVQPVRAQERQSASDHEQSRTTAQIAARELAKVRLPFIKNDGQVDQQVMFYATTFAGTVFVTEVGLTYAFIEGASQEGSVQGVAVKEKFLTEETLRPTGLDKSDAVVNYFVGAKDRWRSHIPTYDAVGFGEVWPGIEIQLRAIGKNVEKLFIVQPGGAVEDIRLGLEGVRSLKVGEVGELLLEIELGTLAMTRPLAYQEIGALRKPVEASYSVVGNTYGFEVGDYDPRYALVIDPILASTFIGAGDSDFASIGAIALDSFGDVFVAGGTRSINYPTTAGALDTSFNGNFDLFVSKLDSSLSFLLASTFIGGSSDEFVFAIALDSFGDVFVTGHTRSTNYPTTAGAFDTTHNGGIDGFVTKLKNDLSPPLLASTFIGGSGSDAATAIALDSFGDVLVSGSTESTNYPTTAGGLDTSLDGIGDAFVSKFDSSLSSLLASTFIGGSDDAFPIGESATGIALDTFGDVFLSGITASTNYPTTGSAFDTSFNGLFDVFVSKLDSSLSSILASTFIGGSSNDQPRAIAIDSLTNVFVTGMTFSFNFPTTAGAFDTSFNGSFDIFVSKLDSSLSSLLASTFIGGSGSDLHPSRGGLALDSTNSVFVTGLTRSANFPTTAGAFDESFDGPADGFVSKFDSNLSLLASTVIGGSSFDVTSGITLDSAGDVLVTGATTSTDYPTTVGAFDESFNGSADVIVFHITNDLAFLTPEEAIQVLIDDVQDLVIAGVLNQGTGEALTSTLEQALQQLANDSLDAAIKLLEAFINQVNGFIMGGVLSPAEGQALIEAANAIINQLSG